MQGRSRDQAPGEKQSDELILHGRVRRDPFGIGLLVLSAVGIALNGIVFPRLARTGGILQQVSTGILFARAIVFTATGVPRRQRLLPQLLSFLELITDGVATVTGLAAWIWPGYAGRERCNGGWLVPASRIVSTVTYVLHTVRLAFYLSPSRGLDRSRGRAERRPVEHPASAVKGYYREFVEKGSRPVASVLIPSLFPILR